MRLMRRLLLLVGVTVAFVQLARASIHTVNIADLQIDSGIVPIHLASGLKYDERNFTLHQCDNTPGMTSAMRLWCREHTALMKGVSLGTTLALGECQRRFAGRQWNCPRDGRLLTGTWRQANRESAFLQAIIAAGIVQVMARMCAWGHAEDHCSCDRLHLREEEGSYNISTKVLAGQWVWGGCGDDLQRAHLYTRQFLRSFAQPTLAGELAARQNYRAGSKVVREKFHTVCRCVGLTRTCSLRVCWKSVPKVHEVGEKLLKAYKQARPVLVRSRLSNSLPRNSTKYQKKRVRELLDVFGSYKTDQLVYYQPSPVYCTRNVALGSPGTRGRNCTMDEKGIGQCGPLCCFRGHTTVVKKVAHRCNCRFVYCCRVECSQCTSEERLHTCK